jgi:hypothetical protein
MDVVYIDRGITDKLQQKAGLTNNLSFFNRQLSENQISYSKSLQQLFEKLQLKQTCPQCTIQNHISATLGSLFQTLL